MRHFAEHGYEATRVQDIAQELGIAKGSVFQHFGDKQGLFVAAYKRAITAFHAYQDAPDAVQRRGFFATLRYWLERTDQLLRQDWVPYRVYLLGNYCIDLAVRREINRFLVSEDPYGTVAFVGSGIASGELRTDIDPEMIVSILEWTIERFQDALLVEELDPGLFRRYDGRPERTPARIDQFLVMLRGAVGADSMPRTHATRRRTSTNPARTSRRRP
jgi:TetR/AcrR family transcriptional regulator